MDKEDLIKAISDAANEDHELIRVTKLIKDFYKIGLSRSFNIATRCVRCYGNSEKIWKVLEKDI